ncbi:MAG: amidohydrolase, partial [Thermomicrobium sp.]|nr:amidohydrolase [Thermomicrobium sp.]
LRERLADRPLFDHHCTPPERLGSRLQARHLRRCFLPEALPDALDGASAVLPYRLALRWLADLLDCDPTEQAILEARANRAPEEYERLLADDALLGPACAVTDDSEALRAVTEWQEILQRPIGSLVPIEPLAERLLPHCASWDDLRTLFARSLAERIGRGALGFVSDFPRRTSLAIQPIDVATADRSFYEVRAEIDAGDVVRLEHRRLSYALFWTALEVAAELSVPVHVVLDYSLTRDPHADDPALFRVVLDEPRYHHVPLVFVSAVPLHPHALALARRYPHLYLDPGPSFLAYPDQAPSMLQTLLASVPTTKLLASTGGALLPERQWFVAKVWRLALLRAFGSLVDEGLTTLADAEADANLILHGNARRLYRFPT